MSTAWTRSKDILKSLNLPPIEINDSNGFVTIHGVFCRDGIQMYLQNEQDANSDFVGVYRNADLVKSLADKLVDAPLVVQHEQITKDTMQDKLHGWVSETDVVTIDDSTLGTCKVVVAHPEAVHEIITQLNETGEVYLPLSPSYLAKKVPSHGTYHDGIGFLGDEIGIDYEYVLEQVSPVKQCNHLAIVDLGRGGPIAALYATRPPTLDGLYNYPHVTPLQKRNVDNVNDNDDKDTTMNKGFDPKEKEKEEANKDGVTLDMVYDMIKDMGKYHDMMQKTHDMVVDMGAFKDAMKGYKEDMAETADKLQAAVNSLAAAINSSYEASQLPLDHTNSVDQKTQAKGESEAFIFDGIEYATEDEAKAAALASIDKKGKASDDNVSEAPSAFADALASLAQIAQTVQASQETMNDRLAAIEKGQRMPAPSPTADQLAWQAMGADGVPTQDGVQKTSDAFGTVLDF